jgi:transcriptional regulator with XRE-family HTH domain
MLLAVRRIRLEKGLRLQEAARRIEVAPGLLARIETGLEVPWPSIRARLAQLYAVGEADLFTDIDSGQRYLRELGGENRQQEQMESPSRAKSSRRKQP